MFRTLSPGDSLSVAWRKLLQGGRGEVRLYISLQQREQAVWTKDQIKLRNFTFCVWEDSSFWAHWIHSFLRHLSYLGPNPVSLFTLRDGRWLLLASPQLLSNQRGGWPHWKFWEPSFTFGGQKSLMAVTFLDMAGDIFISQMHVLICWSLPGNQHELLFWGSFMDSSKSVSLYLSFFWL